MLRGLVPSCIRVELVPLHHVVLSPARCCAHILCSLVCSCVCVFLRVLMSIRSRFQNRFWKLPTRRPVLQAQQAGFEYHAVGQEEATSALSGHPFIECFKDERGYEVFDPPSRPPTTPDEDSSDKKIEYRDAIKLNELGDEVCTVE
jgi:hypothetical protein